MSVSAQLLGRAQLLHDGELHPLPLDKRGALLAYLACRGDWVVRDRLAFLFWPDTEEGRARVNLRQLLRRAKGLPYASALEIGPERLRWRVDTDLRTFTEANERQDWIRAIEVYRGELLAGFDVRDGGDFGGWLEDERADLHLVWQQAALHCGEALASSDRPAEAAALLYRIWNLDAFEERTLQAYLRNAAASGNRDAALSAYADFEQLLEVELGMKPSAETRDLIAAIEQDQDPQHRDPAAGRAIPRQSEPLVGRQRELGELHGLLEQAECRLLVITGMGGVGKTRLALELAREREGRHRHGVHYAPLVGLGDTELFLSAIAEALSFSFYGPKDLVQQLKNYLRDKDLLLLVDNLEHLIEGADLLADLLEDAPQLKILVTSRQLPELPQVWPYPLEGLGREPARQLFLEAARRQRPHFEHDPGDGEAVEQLSRLLMGLPLALELAAAWVGELTVPEIAEQVRDNLDFLAREGPGPQDSLRAVFSSSWDLLSPEQQRVLARLSVFRGGFERAAAKGVAGASPYLLLSLVARSLIHKAGTGRFEMHEMVRQFAQERLAACGEVDEVLGRHADFFAEALHDKAEAMRQGDWRSYEDFAAIELGNLNAMWEWGLAGRRESLIGRTARDYLAYFYSRALFREQAWLLDRALAAFTRKTLARAVLLNRKGILLVDTGKLASAQPVLEEAEALATHHDNRLEQAITLMNLGRITLHRGDYARTQALWERCRDIFRELDNPIALSEIHGSLGLVAYYRGEYADAIALCRSTIELARQGGHLYSVATAHVDLGSIHRDLDEFEASRRHFLEADRTFQRIDNEVGVMQARLGQATVAILSGEVATARALIPTCLSVFAEVDSRLDLAQGLVVEGDLERAAGDPARARTCYLSALAMTRDNDATALSVEVLRALAGVGEPGVGTLAPLLAVQSHPAATAATRRKAGEQAAALEVLLPAEVVAAARLRAGQLTVEQLIAAHLD